MSLARQAGNIGLLLFALGTALVYLILAAKYESWKLPLAVILVVPLCMLAAVAGMVIAHLPVDIFVQIGLLVLVGRRRHPGPMPVPGFVAAADRAAHQPPSSTAIAAQPPGDRG